MQIDNESAQEIPNNLDLFSSKPVNIAFQQTNIVEYNPVNASGTWPSRFTINSGTSYLNLAHCYLQTSFSLLKKVDKVVDGKTVSTAVPVTATDKISFIQGFGATTIKNLKVVFNGRQVYNSNDLYAYDAYFRRRLGIDTSRHEEDLQLAGYFEDAEGSQISGVGYDKRRRFFEKSGEFHTVTQLDADIFHQNKLLLNHIKLDIEITPHNTPFFVIAQDNTTYIARITAHKLYIKHQHLLPTLDIKLNKQLYDGDLAKYPYTRSLVKNFFIAGGRHEYTTTLFTDYVPKRVFVALVEDFAFNGSGTTSPFEFKPYGLDRIQISVNSKIVPAYPYDLGKGEYARAFKDLVDITDNTGITYEKFLTHSCIFGFDLQHYHSDKANNPQEMGITALSLKFAAPVGKSGLQAIVFAQFDSLLNFDVARNFTTALPV